MKNWSHERSAWDWVGSDYRVETPSGQETGDRDVKSDFELAKENSQDFFICSCKIAAKPRNRPLLRFEWDSCLLRFSFAFFKRDKGP
ncbi:uncharacterized protein N7529_002262 [Penicillium soppii]|uniref:uncharacterized protein n=1 Tax=Penicillium soppii TaxID=69789 RepID=UPI002549736E|nr:uncharacterized protein N7529_002262 [Penicillium soppii]KAJ5873832.1 hypothetical protein N7529_002262 [Penicillium soppii]